MSGILESAVRGWIESAIADQLRPLTTEVTRLIDELRIARERTCLSAYLTAEEAAAIAKVRPATVRSWVSRRILQGHYAGRKLRIRLNELERFMQRERRVHSVE